MSFNNTVVRLYCVALGLALILVTSSLTSAKPTRPSHTSTAPPATTTASLNLSDFGAVGNGVADDGPAFQRALDALAAAGGGTLFVPAGTYFIATPVLKDFSAFSNGPITIQGVPSLTMPAPVTAFGHELAAGLDLTSQIIPATGSNHSAFILKGVKQLTVEHIGFTGRPDILTDAFVTLYLSDIGKATIRHCEFYGLSSFGIITEEGGGNIIRSVRSDLSIELSVFLGCTASSGAYGPLVQNLEWRKFTITNSIFLDYGLRAFYGKTGYGAPLSWLNIGNAAQTTPESLRREFVVRDTFLDEGGWVGISALTRWGPSATIDLLYISGLKMNVSNLNMTGHLLYDIDNLLIENSHYGWSHNAYAALDLNRVGNAILDNLTCIDHADRLHADDLTRRLTVINSQYSELDSHAQTTTVFDTTPEEDPVQYVRHQFLSALARQPDPAAHFYWSDLLIKCGQNNDCLNGQRAALSQYLAALPEPEFALAGTVVDENGSPLSDVAVNLTGSETSTMVTDSAGRFRFAGMPTSGAYTVTVNKRHYTFGTGSQTFTNPTTNINAVFSATLDRHSISGRITRTDSTAAPGVTVQLSQFAPVTTDSNGYYSFAGLAAGQNYTVVPSLIDFDLTPGNVAIEDLSADQTVNFVAKSKPELLTIGTSQLAVALDSITFVAQPFSTFNSLGLNPDGLTRVSVFAKNFEPSDAPSQISVVAEDDEGHTYPLTIEYIGAVVGQSWLKQVNIQLSPNLPKGRCLQLRLSLGGVTSNNARICTAGASSSSQVQR